MDYLRAIDTTGVANTDRPRGPHTTIPLFRDFVIDSSSVVFISIIFDKGHKIRDSNFID